MSKVHYWELSNYNSGRLIGRWFDLDGISEEDHRIEIEDWLEELTEETGGLCEEIILGDVEDVPNQYVGTWGISGEFFKLMEMVDNSHLDLEVFQAGVELGIPLDKIEEAYRGKFRNDEEFAEEYVESTGMLHDVPDSLKNYFDMERFANDLMYDYLEADGHYFSNYY